MMEHRPEDLVTARMLIVVYGTGAMSESLRRAGWATMATDRPEFGRWSRVADGIAALELGDVS
jgi:hypothetical protein